MSSINPKQSIMQTLEAMPEDMRLLIVSKVG
ncbi:BnaC03g59680D [Brassica napus]|uniref:BnaC03g59680D protein n=4 Tax=Brassica TaxID=3705 RepID=A0A078FGG3_BRANA|nr:BnaC03g59680D [Brassica napus]